MEDMTDAANSQICFTLPINPNAVIIRRWAAPAAMACQVSQGAVCTQSSQVSVPAAAAQLINPSPFSGLSSLLPS